MSEWECPICGQAICEYVPSQSEYERYECKTFDFRFFLSQRIKYEADTERKERILDLITEHMLHSKTCVVNGGNRCWYFFEGASGYVDQHPEYVNVENLLSKYPAQVMDVAHRALINLSLALPHYGDTFCPMYSDRRVLFEHNINNTGNSGVAKILEELGYLKDKEGNGVYSISAQGWQKIDELRQESKIVRQGFIAMAFKEETKPIREAFRKAIRKAGYAVAVIDEKEHNNQIVPEIFYEIGRSQFVVVDVTYPNYGAYYEAGYAQALGKQVIICCREDAFKDDSTRPHFDISQKSMVVWKDEEDLIARLKRRIEATVI